MVRYKIRGGRGSVVKIRLGIPKVLGSNPATDNNTKEFLLMKNFDNKIP